MKRTVLLASRDEALQETRSLVLRSAGYQTTEVTDLVSVLAMASRMRPEIVILGHSFQPEEQAALVEELHETMPGLLVICMRVGVVTPELLLGACAAASDGQPGSQRVRVLGAEDAFHMNGFHRDGFHRDGFRADGAHANGSHTDGFHADGFRHDGFKKLKVVDSE
jgi:CheY-like chemotaxis protein